MQASLTTTDSIYSILGDNDVGERIADLGREPSLGDPSHDETIRRIEELLDQPRTARR